MIFFWTPSENGKMNDKMNDMNDEKIVCKAVYSLGHQDYNFIFS